MKTEIKQTADGSHTLFIPALNEHYHSTNGSVQESRHVFIQTGLHKAFSLFPDQPVELLEVGFGTGLNALLTCLEADKVNRKIKYTGIEAFPLENEIIQKLNFTQCLPQPEAGGFFQKMHKAAWEEKIEITDNFSLQKIRCPVQELEPGLCGYHLIYFDAFAPTVQPELWTEAVFGKLYQALKAGGILITYSSKGEVKQNLRAAGFTLERLPGPFGKRHMLRACKE